MISTNEPDVEFGGTTPFSDISFVINKKDGITLMDKNDVSKSALLKILAGTYSPDLCPPVRDEGRIEHLNKKLKMHTDYNSQGRKNGVT